MKNNKRAGISLVALVVTIIVLIILTAAVIVTFMEGGIVDRAKEAVFKSDIRTYQEILAIKNAENQIEIATGNGEGSELNGSTLAEIQEIIPEFKEEYEGLIKVVNGEIVLGLVEKDPYTKWLGDLGIGGSLGEAIYGTTLASVAKVGNYVKYIPDGETSVYNLLFAESGYYNDPSYDGYNEGEEIDQEITGQNINWKVLKNDGTNVTLISETPIDDIGFGDQAQVNNAPGVLDKIYSTIYGGTKAKEARNLNLADVNEIMGYEVNKAIYWQDSNPVEVDYGTEYKWDYYGTEDKVEVKEISYKGSDYVTTENQKQHDMIFTQTTPYWLSTYILKLEIWSGGTYYKRDSLYTVGTYGEMGIISTCEIDNNLDPSCYGNRAGRPIVVLNANVVIEEAASGDGSSVDLAWQLK